MEHSFEGMISEAARSRMQFTPSQDILEYDQLCDMNIKKCSWMVGRREYKTFELAWEVYKQFSVSNRLNQACCRGESSLISQR